MAEIVLIRPKPAPIAVNYEESRPPTGLIYVAAPLVHHGFDVVIIDQTVHEDWKERLLEAINNKTLCVGVTCMTGYMIINGIEIAKLVRKYYNCPIVWGGVHPTLEQDTTIASEYVDIIVMGEGEETFLELVNAFKKRESIENINGIVYKMDGKVYKTGCRKPYDLNNLPPLPFHLVDLDCYIHHWKLTHFFRFKNYSRAVAIETSRGCTHRCIYCVMANENYIETGRSRWRGMTASKLADEVERIIKQYGIKAFTFVDDNFFVNVRRAKEFLDEIERRNFSIEWFADIRMDTIVRKLDTAFLKRLENAGLRSLSIGIESGSNRILKHLCKGETRETYIKANKMLATTSIIPQYGFILGLPTEKRDDVAETFTLVADLIMRNPNSLIMLNKLLPNPKTPLFLECIKHGYDPPKKLEDWADVMDTGWSRGPSVWMDKEAVKLIMSLFYYRYLLDRVRGMVNNAPIFEKVLKVATRLLLYRIEKKRYYFFQFERLFYEIAKFCRLIEPLGH